MGRCLELLRTRRTSPPGARPDICLAISRPRPPGRATQVTLLASGAVAKPTRRARRSVAAPYGWVVDRTIVAVGMEVGKPAAELLTSVSGHP